MEQGRGRFCRFLNDFQLSLGGEDGVRLVRIWEEVGIEVDGLEI